METDPVNLKEAVLWADAGDRKVKCRLCNFSCLIGDGKVGHCFVRKNIDGKLYSLNYHKICAAGVDPVEKKPLYHFQPGSKSFSIAAPGCNFRCEFCQNWHISQVDLQTDDTPSQKTLPGAIVDSAIEKNCKSIAYTYTEPTIFMEICNDTARIAKDKGLANIFVSNGYETPEAIDFAAEWLDGINVDLKAFSDDYYRRLCKAHLSPVLETITHIAKNTDIWLEITTLIIDGENDSDDELKQLAEFIVASAGADTPWHISRFYPQYKYADSAPTAPETFQRAYEIGKAAGLNYIYIGNIATVTGENTYCPGCEQTVIERSGYTIISNKTKNGTCPKCAHKISGFEL